MTDAQRILREWLRHMYQPWSPWFYLWTERAERGVSDALDDACGYDPGSGLWTLDAAFSGVPLISCEMSYEWKVNGAPLLVIFTHGRMKSNSDGFKRGFFLTSPLDKFLTSYLREGYFETYSVKQYEEAVKKASPRHRQMDGIHPWARSGKLPG